jgi:hypothetical protein
MSQLSLWRPLGESIKQCSLSLFVHLLLFFFNDSHHLLHDTNTTNHLKLRSYQQQSASLPKPNTRVLTHVMSSQSSSTGRSRSFTSYTSSSNVSKQGTSPSPHPRRSKTTVNPGRRTKFPPPEDRPSRFRSFVDSVKQKLFPPPVSMETENRGSPDVFGQPFEEWQRILDRRYADRRARGIEVPLVERLRPGFTSIEEQWALQDEEVLERERAIRRQNESSSPFPRIPRSEKQLPSVPRPVQRPSHTHQQPTRSRNLQRQPRVQPRRGPPTLPPFPRSYALSHEVSRFE